MVAKSEPMILYIEDNQDNQKLVHRILKAAGYHVVGVQDGMTGLEFVKTAVPDLILVDIQLPVLDGYTVTRELRKIPNLSFVPIVALSANVLKEHREKSFAAGCDGFINKPINVDLLPDQIRSYINK